MASGKSKKVASSPAKSPRKKPVKNTTSSQLSPTVIVQIVAVLGILVSWAAYVTLKPPPPNAFSVNSPRVKLRDGRHLAYREAGVPKQEAYHKIIVAHGLNSSKDVNLPLSQGLIDEHRIYILFFDRAGYGESDPYSKRTVKTDALDMEELADKLQVGPKFHVFGLSLGAYPIWSCLKYIPHRLSGATLIAPFVNYWWPGFPPSLANEAFKSQLVQDQWAFRVAHYAPNWLFNWWCSQKWFSTLSMIQNNKMAFSKEDIQFLETMGDTENYGREKIKQQGLYESLLRDVMVAYGEWEFDPLDLDDPFPNNEGAVHLWQGLEDTFIFPHVTKFIAQKLPWIQYHEVPGAGHLLVHYNTTTPSYCDIMFKAIVLGSKFQLANELS